MTVSTIGNISKPTVLITGGGSGTGRATALELAGTHHVVVFGRRSAHLGAVVAEVEALGGTAEAIVADIGVPEQYAAHLAELDLTDLVVASGLNTPRRTWADGILAEHKAIADTNLFGTMAVVQVVLPALRRRGGTIVLVSSLSSWEPAPGAGVAYRATKMALDAVSRSVNEQEARHGVRSCHLCPGEIDSEFLDLRPTLPTREQRAHMLAPADVAATIRFVLNVPRHARIEELVLTPMAQEHP